MPLVELSNKNTTLISVLFFILFCLQSSAILAQIPETSISGFMRVVGGYVDEEYTEYQGYSDTFRLSKNSLLGIQTDTTLTEKLSLTSVWLAHSHPLRESGLEWLYLNYRPSNAWDIKIGKIRPPIFSLSDTLDIGFAYPYIIPSRQIYNSILFKQTLGAHARYNYIGSVYRSGVEFYAGHYDKDKVNLVDKVQITANIDQFFGLIGTLGFDKFDFRAAYFSGEIDLTIPSLPTLINITQQVQQSSGLDFSRSLNALSTSELVELFQTSAAYENTDYFIRGEFTRVYSDMIFVPNTKAYFTAVGRYFPPFTVYATYTNINTELRKQQSDIPSASPLANLYTQNIYNVLSEHKINNTSLGIRWDIKHNIALKFEAKHLHDRSKRHASFRLKNNTTFSGTANFYTVALDWVF